MKIFNSIKIRITIWYTALMFFVMLVIFSVVWVSAYQLSIDSIEKDIVLQVTQVTEKLNKRQRDVFDMVKNKEEFKNVSIYEASGKYIAGQYIYDIANISFSEGKLRRENIDGKEYIIYDKKTISPPGMQSRFYVRGIESVNSVVILGKSLFMIILILVPVILILIAVGGYYVTKKSFTPVNNILKTANEIAKQKDITRRIEIDQEARHDELHHLSVTLNKMLDKIESLIKQEKQFTQDASHELRTPVSVILAQGEYLLDIAKDDKEKELARNIVEEANKITNLVSSLLLLSRIDQQRQRFNKENVDIGVATDVAISTLTSLASEKEISLITNIPEGTFVEADETLLISVLTNLISNGIKYGKKSGHVIISSKKIDKNIEVTVSDDGIGISKEHIDKIWQRFYRVDDVRNDEYGSRGLGLSMVKSIIELHGGKITVESKPNEGTKFKFTLN